MRLRWFLLLLLTLPPARAGAQAIYDNSSAAQYINAWWNSDVDGNGFVDHVNNSSEAALNFPPPLGPVGPVPDKNYLWYNNVGGNLGDNGRTLATGDETAHPNDCTNFVSQALIKGGIPINSLKGIRPDWVSNGGFGQGDTLLRVRYLDAALKSIAQRQVFTLSASGPNPAPTGLVPGDIVEWGEPHMTMVVSGTGANVLLGYHSNDNINVPLVNGQTGIYDLFKAAHVSYCQQHSPAGTDCSFSNYTIQGIAYHITGTNIQASLDTTPPTYIVQDSSGQTIPDGGATAGTISVKVTDSQSGVEALEVTVGGPILDSLAPILHGTADLIFMDHTSYGPGTHTYSVDLNSVPNGSQVFIEALDAAGNLAPIQSFTAGPADTTPPTLTAFDANGNPIHDGDKTQSPIIKAEATDSGSGVSILSLAGSPYNYPDGVADTGLLQFATVSGTNTIVATDRSGNTATINFTKIDVLPNVNLSARHVYSITDSYYSIAANGAIDSLLFEGVSGTPAAQPAVLCPSTFTMSVSDPLVDQNDPSGFLTGVSVPGAKHLDCFPPLPFPSETKYATCTFLADGTGVSSLVASGASGSTDLKWNPATLTVGVDPQNSSVGIAGNQLNFNTTLTADASAGVGHVRSFDTTTPNDIDDRSNLSFSGLPDMVSFTTSPYERDYYVYDALGNIAIEPVLMGAAKLTTLGGGGSTDPRGGSTTNTGAPIYIGTALQGSSFNGVISSKAVAVAGLLNDSRSGAPLTSPNVSYSGGGSGSISVYLRSGYSLDSTQQNVVGSESLIGSYSFSGGSGTSYLPLALTPVLGSYVQVRTVINSDTLCSTDADCATAPTSSASIGFTLFAGAISTEAITAAAPDTVLAGSGQTLNFGGNITLSGLNVVKNGVIHAQAGSTGHGVMPLGWYDVNGNVNYTISLSTPDMLSGGFTASVPYSGTPAPLSAGSVKVLFYPVINHPNGVSEPGSAQVLQPSLQTGSLTVSLPGAGYVQIVSSIYASPATAMLGGLTIKSNSPSATLSYGSSDPHYLQVLNILGNKGLFPVGTPVVAGPTGRIFDPPAVVTYDPSVLNTSLQLAQVSLENADQTIPTSQTQDSLAGTYSGYVSQLHSLFGTFTTGTPTALADLIAPQTELRFGSTTVTANGVAVGLTTDAVSFSAVDPPFANAPVSGVTQTRYLLDTPFVSVSSTPGNVFSVPFTLSTGTHSVAYYSVDNAGNTEGINVATLTVVTPPSPSRGGRGIGIASDGSVWETVEDDTSTGHVWLSRNDASGVFLASATLPGGDPSSLWPILFDASGHPYAVGASSDATGARRLAVYKADATGDSLLSSTIVNDGFSNHYVLGATPGWITGAVQTSGTNGGGTALALWSFDPTSGLVQLTTDYTRSGSDGGTSVTKDAGGNLWVAGFSRSSTTLSSRSFDLALWKYASDGRTLLAGPYLRSGYLSNLSPSVRAQALAVGSTIYVAASRGRNDGGTDLALVAFDAATGGVQAESAWRASGGPSVYPSSILKDPSGNLVVAGGFSSAGTTTGGLWTYGSNGTLISAVVTAAGGAQAAAYSGQNLWLAADRALSPALASGGTAATGGLADIEPPRTAFLSQSSAVVNGSLYISTRSPYGLTVNDDKLAVGDNLGVGIAQTFSAVDSTTFTVSSGSLTLTEGLHTLAFYSVDLEGNVETPISTRLAVDATPPLIVLVSSGGIFSLNAQDPVVNGVASGVAHVHYLVDEDPNSCSVQPSTSAPVGTCANPNYAGPFSLAVGTHTIAYQAVDNVGNGQDVAFSSFVVVASTLPVSPYLFDPSTGPVGIPFVLSGAGFGAYAGVNTRVLIGGATAPISVWNDASIKGTIPGLSTGTYLVAVARHNVSSDTVTPVADFQVLLPSATSVSVSSSPIGAPFTLTGTAFGPYAGANTRVLIGGTTAPISVWNDTTIKGSVPGLSTGTYPVSIQRQTADGYVASVSPYELTVVAPTPQGVAPSSAPICAPFTVTGTGFGPYAGASTRILFDGVAAPVSVWNDTTIQGTVPGLTAGVHPLWIERASSDGGLSSSATGYFTVLVPSVTAYSPASGPIGTVVTLTGSGFGPYAGANTRLLIGGTTAPISVWNDATIKGTVPGGLAAGPQPIVVQRQAADGTLSSSDTAYFQLTGPGIAQVSPSSGPAGVSITVAGADFGAYQGSNTRLLIGGTTVPVSVWNDTTITGTVPALATGTYEVAVERLQGTGMAISSAAPFSLTALVLSPPSPSTSPAGAPFTLDGTGFGPYAGANTRLLLGGTTVAVSVWNDSQIKGTVPSLAEGPQPLWIERLAPGGLETSNTVYLAVAVPSVTAVSPGTAPIGAPVTLTGTGFGPYAGANTQVLFGGTTAPVSVWNDAQITATVPGGASTGTTTLQVAREAPDGGIVFSTAVPFIISVPAVAALTPSSGPVGAPFTLDGSGFGPYAGANTQVLFGGTPAAVSVWNDTQIQGTVPFLSTGAYQLTVARAQGSFVSASAPVAFSVTDFTFDSLAPSSGPIGAPFTITGAGFGPYAGANTRLLMDGTLVPVSVWNDTTIKGSVPAVSSGTKALWIERQTTGGVQSSSTGYFQVLVPELASLTPSSAPIGAPFTITGAGFGPYAGANTRVTFNGLAAPVSVWNDTVIKGSVPGAASSGTAVVVVERAVGATLSDSANQAFTVVVPFISTMTPASGVGGTPVTLSGSGFGPYAGSATKLLVAGSTVPLSVWNDSTIRWTAPAGLPDGTYPVVVERDPAGGSVQSNQLSFTVGAGSGGAQAALLLAAPLSAQPSTNFQGDMSLPATEGGTIQTPSKAAVAVPPDALAQDTEVTIDRTRDLYKDQRQHAEDAEGLGSAGEPISFGPEGTQFSRPVTIELPYDPALVPVGALSTLAVHYFDPVTGTWTPMPSTVDPVRHVVVALTSHFSLYQPLGVGVGPAATADQTFGLKAVYVFPNPARGVRSVTFRVQPGQADSVSVRVYDLAGRKIHESSDFTVNSSYDDGNGLGAQITYDHVWDISGVGSGVYYYVITAKKAGHADLHKSGRVGVVK